MWVSIIQSLRAFLEQKAKIPFHLLPLDIRAFGSRAFGLRLILTVSQFLSL